MEKLNPSDFNKRYNDKYARLYLERTLSAPYTIYKNKLLANMARELKINSVLDLGGNVHGAMKTEGSLRFQLEKKGINYTGLDLSIEYFDPDFLKNQSASLDQTYSNVRGVVGDILNLPVKSNSVEMITCCDVLEHVSDPVRALREIGRVTRSDGMALVVLPSLYKLDMVNFDFIHERRKSSHFKKTTIDEWIGMCKDANLQIDTENSRPIGIASGLSYLLWLDEKFIPVRKDLTHKETYSTESTFHRDVKNIFSKYDENIDAIILSKNIHIDFIELIKQGNVKKVFEILKDITLSTVSLEEEKITLTIFFDKISDIEYGAEQIETIKQAFIKSKYPELIIGNSVLLILRPNERLVLSNELLEQARKDNIEKIGVRMVIKKNNSILVLKRARGENFQGLYDLPGGGIEANEDIFSSGIRELQEETGLTVQEFTSGPETVNFLHSATQKKGRQYIFEIIPNDEHLTLNALEHVNYKWISLDEVDDLYMFPETKNIIKQTLSKP